MPENIKQGFFAYSSVPTSCQESIENAIKRINETGVVKITSWKQLEINGKFIINEVLKKVDESDFFCADLTGMNDNVLFEVGYAIAKNKPVWLIIDKSHMPTNRKFNEFNLLTTIGYSAYTNTDHIVNNFFSDS
jgi:nucleoside 2-deoxyribosyltransferase